MFPRYFALVTGLLLLAGRLVEAQGDAQDRTQSFLDNHKGADVINSDRAITDSVRQSPTAVHESTLPPLTGVSEGRSTKVSTKSTKVNEKEIRKLRSQKATFIKENVNNQRRLAKNSDMKSAMLEQDMIKQATKEWENSSPGQRLKGLERRTTIRTTATTTESTLPKLTY